MTEKADYGDSKKKKNQQLPRAGERCTDGAQGIFRAMKLFCKIL